MKVNKQLIIGLTAGLVIESAVTTTAGMWVSAYKNDEIKVTLNGVQQTFKDETTGEVMYPLTYNDRTYLPLRNVANLAGLTVGYDDASKTAMLASNGYTLPTNTPTPTPTSVSSSLNFSTFNLYNDAYINSLGATRSYPKDEYKKSADLAAEMLIQQYIFKMNATSAYNYDMVHSKTPIRAAIIQEIDEVRELLDSAQGNLSLEHKNVNVKEYYSNGNEVLIMVADFDIYLKETKIGTSTALIVKDKDVQYSPYRIYGFLYQSASNTNTVTTTTPTPTPTITTPTPTPTNTNTDGGFAEFDLANDAYLKSLGLRKVSPTGSEKTLADSGALSGVLGLITQLNAGVTDLSKAVHSRTSVRSTIQKNMLEAYDSSKSASSGAGGFANKNLVVKEYYSNGSKVVAEVVTFDLYYLGKYVNSYKAFIVDDSGYDRVYAFIK